MNKNILIRIFCLLAAFFLFSPLCLMAQGIEDSHASDSLSKHRITPFIVLGSGNLLYQVGPTKSSGGFGFQAGANYRYLFHPHYFFETGISINSYTSHIPVYQENHTIVKDATDHTITLFETIDTKEKLSATYLNIPIKVGYQYSLSSKWHFRFLIGFAYGLKIGTGARLESGTVKRWAELEGGGEPSEINPDWALGTFKEFQLSTKGLKYSDFKVLLEVNFAYQVSQKKLLEIGFYYSHGLGSIASGYISNSHVYDGVSTSSLISSIDTRFIGFSLGFPIEIF